MSDDRIDRVRAVLEAAEDVDLPEGIVAPQSADQPAGDDDEMPPPPPPEQGDGYDWGRIEAAAAEPLNDYGNARRFVIHFGEDLRHHPHLGYFVWDGMRWKRDVDSILVRAMVHRMGDLIARETVFITVPARHAEKVDRRESLQDRVDEIEAMEKPGPAERAERTTALKEMKEIAAILAGVQDLRGQRLRHAKNAGNSGPMDNMLAEAGIMLAVRVDQLDADPLKVNTTSGTLVFSIEKSGSIRRASVTLKPHDRADLISRLCPVPYDEDAATPHFQPFLNQVIPDPGVQGYLQRIGGLSLLGLTEQVLIYNYGDGANGKSVFMDAIAGVLGEYAATAKIETFTGTNRRSAGDPTPELIPLITARMVRASEPEKGTRWQEGLIKAMTGGEPMLARELQKGFIEFRPRFTMVISGNYKPEFDGTDDGIWRRMKLIEWPVQIAEPDRLPKEEMDARMAADHPGILRWMVEGALNYLEAGLMEPDAIRDATRALREDSDNYGTFLEDACIVSGDGAHRIPASELTHAFQFWLARAGLGYIGDQKVSKQMADHARRWRSRKTGQKFNRQKSAGAYWYVGIAFTDFFKKDWFETPKDSRGRPLISGPSQGPSEIDSRDDRFDGFER